MSHPTTMPVLPAALQGMPDLKMRALNIALAVTALALPVAVATNFGFSTSVSLNSGAAAGSVAYLLPVTFVAALAIPAIETARPWTRVIDIVAAAVAFGFLAFIAYAIYSAVGQINDAERAFGSMMGGGYRRPSMASVSPGIGIAPLALLALLASWKAWRGR